MNETHAESERRKAQLRSVVEAYFRGLAGKNIAAVPYHDDVILRAPLAPGGSESPLRGREAVVGYLNSVLTLLGEFESSTGTSTTTSPVFVALLKWTSPILKQPCE